jgi:hypothetical protein
MKFKPEAIQPRQRSEHFVTAPERLLSRIASGKSRIDNLPFRSV